MQRGFRQVLLDILDDVRDDALSLSDDEDGGGESERQASSLRAEAGGDTPDARSDATPTWRIPVTWSCDLSCLRASRGRGL